MSASRVFAARLVGCSVFDPNGDRVGRVRDILVVRRQGESPRVVGMVVEVPGKRRVFLSIGRITSIGAGQIITTGLINLRRFEQRGGELRIVAELLGRKVRLRDGSGEAQIEDLAIEEAGLGEWHVNQAFLRRPKTGSSPFGRGPTVFAPWNDLIENSTSGEAQSATQLVESYADLLPADLASAMLDLPEQRMIEVAEELSDGRLADVLEEMPENEQVDILNQLDDDRAADVLDHMQPDDAADLIAHLTEERGETLLELMEPEEAEDVRFLLSYAPDTAGGLMTTEPIIVSADATVAEGLALIRRHELAPALAAAICVTLPPYEPPTGRYLGVVHFQRMLRYPPNERLGTLLDTSLEPVRSDSSAADVARTLASYNLVSVPVVDENHRLVGVVTIDDVLDHVLPDDWRSTDHEAESFTDTSTATITRVKTAPKGKEDDSWLELTAAAPRRSDARLDAPKGLRTGFSIFESRDRFGRFTESIARGMGTLVLLGLSGFVIAWMLYNTLAPEPIRFDSAAIGFTALTLILSLQASYAAPLILLAQNRQDDRDRVQIEQDRQRSERNLNDTEYLAREVVALRLAMNDLASKEFIRAELRSLLEELDRDKNDDEPAAGTGSR